MSDRIDPSADPDLAGLGASMRAEWREDAEQRAAEAADTWRHARTLLDVATECMHRGDEVVVDAPPATFRGVVVDVRADLLALRTASGRVDVHAAVPFGLRVAGRATAGGDRPAIGAGSFRGRLLDLERGGPVALGSPLHAEALRGRLAVGHDHVAVGRDGAETFLPLAAVAWVAPEQTEDSA